MIGKRIAGGEIMPPAKPTGAKVSTPASSTNTAFFHADRSTGRPVMDESRENQGLRQRDGTFLLRAEQRESGMAVPIMAAIIPIAAKASIGPAYPKVFGVVILKALGPWRSLVARLLGVQEVPSSNLGGPTNIINGIGAILAATTKSL